MCEQLVSSATEAHVYGGIACQAGQVNNDHIWSYLQGSHLVLKASTWRHVRAVKSIKRLFSAYIYEMNQIKYCFEKLKKDFQI